MADDKVTLWVGISFSSCEACGQNALPQEQTHDRFPAWSDTDRKGCGARFTHISSSYSVPAERLREMRPDLEVIDLFPSDASLGGGVDNPQPAPQASTQETSNDPALQRPAVRSCRRESPSAAGFLA